MHEVISRSIGLRWGSGKFDPGRARHDDISEELGIQALSGVQIDGGEGEMV